MKNNIIYVDFIIKKRRVSSNRINNIIAFGIKIKNFFFSSKESTNDAKIYPFKKIL